MIFVANARARRALAIIATTFTAILLIHVVLRLVAFANLFRMFKAHSGVPITQLQIYQSYGTLKSSSTKEPVVPKIIHQIFHSWHTPRNDTLPLDWQVARRTCIDRNPDWEHKLWTSDTSREFIEDEFPWFLDTYDAYKFPVQRVDVTKYFVLRKYGGIYIDLDNGCAESLNPLTYYPAFITDGGHGTLSNNIMGGQPDHPLFRLVTENLESWNRNWILPYVIISFTSGQWFMTAMWEKYHSLLSDDGTVRGFEGTGWHPLHHVLMDMRPGTDPWVFFTQVRGGTWDNWDSVWFGWIGVHIRTIIGSVCVFLALLISCCMWCCRRQRRSRDTKAPSP